MIKTTYQTPELRNANDEVVQEGAFGKNTALTNSTNDGWIDYVMNDLEALHDTIGDSAPTLDGNGHVVEPANLAIGDEDGVRLKTGYVKTSGGTVSGTLNVAQNLKMQDNQENVFGGFYVPASSATSQFLQLYGGETPSSNGGNLQLPSDGSWMLQAKNGTTAYNLVGGTDGTLKWRGNNVAVAASPAFTGNPTAPTQAATDNSTKIATTAFVNSFLANSTTTMRFIGVDVTGGAENDTREFWQSKGNCITYVSTLNQVYEQPKQWGFIVSLVIGTEVNQTFFDQTSGLHYSRTANRDMTAMPGWVIVGVSNGSGSHNNIYREYNLGTAVTSGQWEEIRTGRFRGMYIGDYWTINNVNWRIAAFDYFYKTGDRECATHHVIIVPDTNLVSCKMNDTNITTGAYIGSDFYTGNNNNVGRSTAINAVNNAFGSEHVLTHREYLHNAVTDGHQSGSAWYDCTIELMNEHMVYGGKFFENACTGGTAPDVFSVSKSQLPLFAHEPSRITNRANWWLRSVVTTTNFASVRYSGAASHFNASTPEGVRPYFAIYQA